MPGERPRRCLQPLRRATLPWEVLSWLADRRLEARRVGALECGFVPNQGSCIRCFPTIREVPIHLASRAPGRHHALVTEPVWIESVESLRARTKVPAAQATAR